MSFGHNCDKCGSRITATICSVCGNSNSQVYSDPFGGTPHSTTSTNFLSTESSGLLSDTSARQYAMWGHLTPFLLSLFGILLSFFGIGFAVGLILWLPPLIIKSSSKSNPFVRKHTIESINFHLFWLIFWSVSFVIYIFVGILTAGLGLALGAIVYIIVIIPIGIFILVNMIRASVAASSGRGFRYPLVLFRLVK
ncbi:MAG: DUF4870 domain-containing protein [Actinomycetes bacterium]